MERTSSTASKLKAKSKLDNESNDYILKFRELASKVKDQIPNIFKLLTITLTIPITSVECKRSFSCVWRIKDYKRNNSGDDWSLNLMAISSGKNIT